MALKITVSAADSTIGVQMVNAYARIGNMYFNDRTFVRFSVSYYVSKAARDTVLDVVTPESPAPVNPFKTVEFSMDAFDHEAEESPKSQLYTFMKTLPAFADAVDI